VLTNRRPGLPALLVAATLALAACGTSTPVVEAAPGDGAPPATSEPTAAPSAVSPRSTPSPLPRGWRWESYRDVELAVPGDWTWIGGTQRTHQWCVGVDEKPTGVGRPGSATLVGCGGGKGDPGTRIATNGAFVAFGDVRFDKVGTVGDRTTVGVGDVAVLVQTEPGLRDRIIATVHRITVDASGCPVRDEVTAHPALKPAPAIALKRLTGVRSVSACLYDLDEGERGHEGPSLNSSVRLEGPAAAKALAAVARAPAAGGQDRPKTCLYKYGSEMVVLLIESAAGPSRVHVRFSGCDHNAVDDGVSPRRLTPALRPFFSGPNQPDGISGGSGKAEAIFGVRPDGTLPARTPPPG
jgi:hypothetical protein